MTILDAYRVSLEGNDQFYEQVGSKLIFSFGAPGMPLKMTVNVIPRVQGKPADRVVIVGGLEDGSALARDIARLDKYLEVLLLMNVLNSHGWSCGKWVLEMSQIEIRYVSEFYVNDGFDDALALASWSEVELVLLEGLRYFAGIMMGQVTVDDIKAQLQPKSIVNGPAFFEPW